MKTRILRCLLAIAIAATAASAQQMNYQGRLTDNAGAPRPGPQASLTFSMWTLPIGGNKVWGDFVVNADLIDGRFSVKLGDANGNDGTAGGGRLLSNAFATSPGPRYLEIKVGTDAPLPRQQVLPAPTALHAVIASTVPDGAIGTNQLSNFAVTGAKIADGTITVAKLTGAGANFWDGNGTNVWRAGGNVGIGTAVPSQILHVQTPGAQTGRIHVGGTGANGNSKIISFGDGDFVSIGESGADDRMVLNASAFHFNFGSVGIGTSAPVEKLDVAGNINVSGAYLESGQHVPSSEEDLRIVRGLMYSDASVAEGSGWSAVKTSTGTYKVTLTAAFSGKPVITATCWNNNPGNYAFITILHPIEINSFILEGRTQGGALKDYSISFIAIGPR